MRAAPLGLILFLSAITAARADCIVHGDFTISSGGSASMAADSGRKCESQFMDAEPGVKFASLWVINDPASGKLDLRKGGFYAYTSRSGFTGRDAFTLRICGDRSGKQICSLLKFQVSVR